MCKLRGLGCGQRHTPWHRAITVGHPDGERCMVHASAQLMLVCTCPQHEVCMLTYHGIHCSMIMQATETATPCLAPECHRPAQACALLPGTGHACMLLPCNRQHAPPHISRTIGDPTLARRVLKSDGQIQASTAEPGNITAGPQLCHCAHTCHRCICGRGC